MITTHTKGNGEESEMENKKKLQVKQDGLSELMDKTNTDNPNPTDVNKWRNLFKKNPQLYYCEPFNIAENVINNTLNGIECTEYAKEVALMNIRAIKESLGYKKSPPIENLLIEQVCITWLIKTLMETKYSENLKNAKNTTLKYMDYVDRMVSKTQNRYLRAIEMLARIRKLTGTTVQINIAQSGGKQQVNNAL